MVFENFLSFCVALECFGELEEIAFCGLCCLCLSLCVWTSCWLGERQWWWRWGEAISLLNLSLLHVETLDNDRCVTHVLGAMRLQGLLLCLLILSQRPDSAEEMTDSKSLSLIDRHTSHSHS